MYRACMQCPAAGAHGTEMRLLSNMQQQIRHAAKLAALPPASTSKPVPSAQQGPSVVVTAESTPISPPARRRRRALAPGDRNDEACRAVGAAVDRLEQVRHTRGEIGARVALERAATTLRRIIRERSGHDPR